jgi:phosphoribosylglycinamide formyltransferase-1
MMPSDSLTRPGLLGVLISGRGSNLQSIIDAIGRGDLEASIAVVISNRADAPGLLRAREAGIEAVHLDPRVHADRSSYDRQSSEDAAAAWRRSGVLAVHA